MTTDQLASTPVEGDWLVIRGWGLKVSQIAKVTPKLFKLLSHNPCQVGREDKTVICHAKSREQAEALRDAIAGIDGEFARRRRAADDERNARVKVAEEARQKAIARLLREQGL